MQVSRQKETQSITRIVVSLMINKNKQKKQKTNEIGRNKSKTPKAINNNNNNNKIDEKYDVG